MAKRIDQVGDLDLTDDLDYYTFETHCEMMYDILSLESPKHAAELLKSDRFWTKKWQMENRQRQREKMFCCLEEITSGEAARQLLKRGAGQMSTMRRFFFEHFGAGQPEVLAERAKHYLIGMPDKDGEVFPPRCNMEIKWTNLKQRESFYWKFVLKTKGIHMTRGRKLPWSASSSASSLRSAIRQ
jgi:hypothetical protein